MTEKLQIKGYEITLDDDIYETQSQVTWRPAPLKGGQMLFERTVVTKTDTGEKQQHRQKLHRAVFGEENIPEGHDVLPINDDWLNLCRENLRLVAAAEYKMATRAGRTTQFKHISHHKQSGRYQAGGRLHETVKDAAVYLGLLDINDEVEEPKVSRFSGVYWNPNTQQWDVYIRVRARGERRYRRVFVESYSDEITAAKANDAALIKAYGSAVLTPGSDKVMNGARRRGSINFPHEHSWLLNKRTGDR